MNGNYHQERSRLIQQHKEEIKSIEKEIKSKKGTLKEQYQRQLEEAQKRHEEEMREFESKHGNGEDKTKKGRKPSGSISSSLEAERCHSGKTVFYEERQWNSLSKSELEVECKLRGLNSKGSKEDLVTRLFIFTADQKSKISKISHDEQEGMEMVKSRGKANSQLESSSIKGFTVVSSSNKFAPPEINYSEAGGTGRRKGRSHNRKVDHRKNAKPGQNSWAAFCARNDIPRKKNTDLNIHEDSNLENSSDEENEREKQSSSEESRSEVESSIEDNERRSSDSDSGSNSEGIDEEELARRNKRRAVMVKVLEKMFSSITISEKKNGLKLSEIQGQLTRLNVKNFKPELLGYKSVEDWVSSQPKTVLTYDEYNQLIFPPGHKIPASNNSKKDDPYYVDSLSEEGGEKSDDDFFM
ncbi:SAP domain [Cryptosporidium sp. chipmunk genotype I]|uniref:SAP domain n=1 Tax=Cryptosporidium sp. chipmunk genotype I TaxID=1280935 RepID=UPI00351A41D3|nr:SAP domain [Cryptosporidium sp. chipmunk genotype I]